jgi:hypothetical protein
MLARRPPHAAALGLALLAIVACQPKPRDIPGPEQPWQDMNHADRQAYMAQAVLPHMQAAFQSFDAERFATVDCATCHVTGAAAGTFAMPDPGLPKLSRRHFNREHMQTQRETVRFMWEHVEPEMSALLGGPKGQRGFNCRNCHTVRP